MMKDILKKFSIGNLTLKTKQFLIWVGGGNPVVVFTRVPNSESLFLGVGSIIFAVAIISTCVGIMGAHIVLSNNPSHYIPKVLHGTAPFLALFFGLVYGGLIFSLDRLLVATCPSLMEENLSRKKKVLAVASILLRLALAMALAHQITLLATVSLSQNELYDLSRNEWVKKQLALQEKENENWVLQIQAASRAVRESLTAIDALKNELQLHASPISSVVSTSRVPSRGEIKQLAREMQTTEKSKTLSDKNKRQFQEVYEQRLKAYSLDILAENKRKEFEVNRSAVLLDAESSLNGSLNDAIEHFKKSREHKGKIIDSYHSWIESKPDVSALSKQFEECKNVTKTCEMPKVGIFTLIRQLEKNRDQEFGKHNFDSILEITLIILEITALTLKVLSDRGRYIEEYNEWELEQSTGSKTKERTTQAHELTKTALEQKFDLASFEANMKNNFDKETEDRVHDLNTHLVQSKTTMDYVSVITSGWSKPPSGHIPSAFGLHQNIKFATDSSSGHSPAPNSDAIPSAESIAIKLNGSLKKSTFFSVLSIIMCAVLYAIYLSKFTAAVSITPREFVIYTAILGGLVWVGAFIFTSPGFNTAVKPALWLVVAVFLLAGVIYLSGLAIDVIPTAELSPAISEMAKNMNSDIVYRLFYGSIILFVLFIVRYATRQLNPKSKTSI